MNALDLHLAVYGSLRIGHGNGNYFLSQTTCVAPRDVLRGYKLYTWERGGYPCIVRSGDDNDTVVVDVFDLNTAEDQDPDNLADRIDGMEFGAGYEKEQVMLESGAVVWVYPMTEESRRQSGMDVHVESGDWTAHCNKRHA